MKKPVIFIAILFLIIGIPVYKKYANNHQANEVETEQAILHKIKASKLASGQLKHEEEVKLTAEVIGKVSRLLVNEGDAVSKGQLLLTIDDQTYSAAVAQQQAVVDQQLVSIEKHKMIVNNLENQWQRKSRLFERKLLDKDTFELITHQNNIAKIELKAAYEVLKQTQANLTQAQDQLSKTQVKSPIKGRITSLDIKEGETAISSSMNIAGSSLMTIANPNTMLAEINVDEADIADIKIGQTAEIIAIAYESAPLTGRVESIASSAKQAFGRQNLSFAVKLALDPIDDSNQLINLRPGMSCRAEVFTQGEQQLLAVSTQAIKTDEDNEKDTVENFVFIVADGIAKKIVIETGVSDDAYQHIINGVKENDHVIIGPDKILRHLNDGDTVTIIDKK